MTVEEELKLRQRLDSLHKWPDVYMFKFIVPAVNDNLEVLLSFFKEGADISQRHSANLNFTSITIKEVMLSTEAVIERYKSITHIPGLISL
jgi:hypothetical protein